MLARLTIATLLAAGTAGCAVSPATVSRPYPVSGNPVNPTPAPDYRVVCSTGQGLDTLIFPARIGYCEQVITPPAAEAIRVRG
ncbi:hypothetical protein [Enterovirga sp.]|uniref:hypothetical protein n=1 Tax=Enterovirga sp. TaxID=2026350 RepID=UPI002B9D22EE|nr:hypothetical protein [Enterovirga sp.]HMO28694.1 hypothetical protein [Enterovirga sp.]